MASAIVSCSKCDTPLPDAVFTTVGPHICGACGASVQVYVFPALLRAQPPGEPGETVVVDGTAGCFYHPHRQAVVPCEHCGRFLCTLCEVEIDGQHLCLTCLDTSNTKGALPSLAQRRTRYDSIALRLVILPTLLLWATLVTAPLTIWYVLWHWRSPMSILPRTKVRFVIALSLATLQILAWLVWFFFLWGGTPV